MPSEMTKNEHIAAILAAGLLANPSRDVLFQGPPAVIAAKLHTDIVIELGNQDMLLAKALTPKK